MPEALLQVSTTHNAQRMHSEPPMRYIPGPHNLFARFSSCEWSAQRAGRSARRRTPSPLTRSSSLQPAPPLTACVAASTDRRQRPPAVAIELLPVPDLLEDPSLEGERTQLIGALPSGQEAHSSRRGASEAVNRRDAARRNASLWDMPQSSRLGVIQGAVEVLQRKANSTQSEDGSTVATSPSQCALSPSTCTSSPAGMSTSLSRFSLGPKLNCSTAADRRYAQAYERHMQNCVRAVQLRAIRRALR